MSKKPRNLNASQKAFADIYDEVCYHHNRWTVWSDFVVMSAASVSNVCDKEHADEREKLYQQISAKYRPNELRCFEKMLAETVNAMELNPDQDYLGEMFSSLNLHDEHNGQFFTPYNICRMMSQIGFGDDIKTKIQKDGWVSVLDPACGAGALLVAFANECWRHGVNYQTSVLFVAQDIDFVVGCMCYLQLSLLGCPGYVVIGDSLANPTTCIDGRGLFPRPGQNIWYTPFFFRAEWNMRRLLCQMENIFSTMTHQASSTADANSTTIAPENKTDGGSVAGEVAEVAYSGAVDWRMTETGQLTFL